MKDQFRKEYRKFPPSRSGDERPPEEESSKWQYYIRLMFLKDVVKYKKSIGNLSVPVTTASEQGTAGSSEPMDVDGNSNMGSDCEEESDSASSGSQSDSDVEAPTRTKNLGNSSGNSIDSSRGKKRKSPSVKESLADIERQNLAQLREMSETKKARREEHKKRKERKERKDQKDDHFSFLMSLWPYMKKIPAERVLEARCRINCVVQEFML